MAGCCDPRGCDGIFGSRYARSRAAAYRRRGLDDDATRMVDYAAARGLDGATVLEIGGGVGEIQVELLRRGAASAVSVELVDAYDRVAEELLASAGLSGRVQRRLLDIAVSPHEVQPADIVVLHRVVCCYPDYGRLLAAAASHAGRVLVFSHPTRNLGTRAVISTQNASCGWAASRSARSPIRPRRCWPFPEPSG